MWGVMHEPPILTMPPLILVRSSAVGASYSSRSQLNLLLVLNRQPRLRNLRQKHAARAAAAIRASGEASKRTKVAAAAVTRATRPTERRGAMDTNGSTTSADAATSSGNNVATSSFASADESNGRDNNSRRSGGRSGRQRRNRRRSLPELVSPRRLRELAEDNLVAPLAKRLREDAYRRQYFYGSSMAGGKGGARGKNSRRTTIIDENGKFVPMALNSPQKAGSVTEPSISASSSCSFWWGGRYGGTSFPVLMLLLLASMRMYWVAWYMIIVWTFAKVLWILLQWTVWFLDGNRELEFCLKYFQTWTRRFVREGERILKGDDAVRFVLAFTMVKSAPRTIQYWRYSFRYRMRQLNLYYVDTVVSERGYTRNWREVLEDNYEQAKQDIMHAADDVRAKIWSSE